MRSHLDGARLAVVLADVAYERQRQHDLLEAGTIPWDCADPRQADHLKIGVLGEEFGEVCKAVIEPQTNAELYAELVQVAAVATAWAEGVKARMEATS